MPNVRLSDAIAEFAIWAKTNYAEGTWRGQRASLDGLLTEVGNIWTKNLTQVHIDRYTAARKAAGVHPHTIRNNLVHLRQFCDFARGRKFTAVNWDPVGRRKTPKVVPHKWVIIEPSEFGRLLDAAANPRDRAVIAFGLYTLCRQSEAKHLRIEDVDLENGWISLTIQKSGIRDRMPISSELHTELECWLKRYEGTVGGLRGSYRLLPALQALGHQRDHLGRLQAVPEGLLRIKPHDSPSKIHWCVQKALRNLGYPAEKEGLHTLRRSAARARFEQLVGQGYDGALREIQALLHHSSLVTTEHYLGLTQTVRRRDESIRGRRMFEHRPPTLRVVGSGGA